LPKIPFKVKHSSLFTNITENKLECFSEASILAKIKVSLGRLLRYPKFLGCSLMHWFLKDFEQKSFITFSAGVDAIGREVSAEVGAGGPQEGLHQPR
jgi:hypothetical protein